MSDEFTLIAEGAREAGYEGDLPAVRRVETATPDGSVSSLVWGDAPEVTFLHGAALNAHTWDTTVLRLGRPALALDLPGHGDSPWRDDFDYSPRTIAPAVIATIDALAGGKPQVVVGQSLGGLTAAALTEARPDLVRALVIVDISPGIRPQDAQQVRSFLAGPLVFESREQIAQLAVAAGIAGPGPALDRGVEFNTRIREDGSIVFKHHLGNPPEGKVPGVPADFGHLWPALESVTVPVLLVRGTQGYLTPEVTDEFLRRVPGSRLVELDSRHNVQEQRPAELADAINDWLG